MMVGRKAESPPPPLSRSQICPRVQLRYYFTCPELDTYTSGSSCVIEAGLPADTTTVLGLGSPLFDEEAVEHATVYVTLSSSDLGLWNPFSWYPYVSPLKWSAIVTDAADVSAAATLFDRGYGYVYLTSESGP